MAHRNRPPSSAVARPTGFVIGRAAFEAIGAVEGIRPTEASRARAIEGDRRGLTAEQRRREIVLAHRPKG